MASRHARQRESVEYGDPKDTSYSIECNWTLEKQTVKLSLGKSKDGMTKIQVRMVTSLK